MTTENKRLNDFIEKGAEIGGSVAGAAIGLAILGPVGVIGGAAFSPIITSVFKKIGTDISAKILSPREEARIGATYTLALDKIDTEIKNGKEIRNDNFFSPQGGDRSSADMILEGTLLKARNEYEEKKIKFYSNFLANLNFDASISFEKGNTLLKIIEKMSYRQIILLGHIEDVNILLTENWLVQFTQNEELGHYHDFFSEVMDLYNQQILKQVGQFGMRISSLELSGLGKTLCKLLNTNEIENEDKNIIIDTICNVNKMANTIIH